MCERESLSFRQALNALELAGSLKAPLHAITRALGLFCSSPNVRSPTTADDADPIQNPNHKPPRGIAQSLEKPFEVLIEPLRARNKTRCVTVYA